MSVIDAASPRSAQILDKAKAEHRRGLAFERNYILSWRIGLLLVVLLAWQLLSGAVLDPFFFSSPSRIFDSLVGLFKSGQLFEHAGYTIYEAFVGYLLGCAAAILAASVFGPSPRLYAIIEPFLLSVYAVPSVAIAPLLIVWFGVGLASKVCLAAYFVFFVVFMNAVTGMRAVQPGWIDTVRVMGASRTQIMTKIVMRGAAPHIQAGLRLAVPEAVIGAIVGEFISSQKGIGYLILSASAKYQTAGVFAAVLILAVLVLVMAAGLRTHALHGARGRGR